MTWFPLKRGPWTRDAPDDRLDPYMLWADTTNFADFRFEVARCIVEPLKPEALVPVLIELRCPLRWPRVFEAVASRPRGVHLKPMFDALRAAAPAGRLLAGSRFQTLAINAKFMGLLKDLPKLHERILRVELCMAVRPEREKVEVWTQSMDLADELVLGVIDDGCPFARSTLRNGMSTRVRAIWDQSSEPAFHAVDGQATREVLDSFINANAGVVDEDFSYHAADYSRLRRRASHGAHVLDVLAGPVPPSQRVQMFPVHPPTFAAESVCATNADIVFVQLPNAAVQDNSGKWLGVNILDGLRFICSKVGRAARTVVNISYGPQTGPHDGSSILERAIDEAHDLMRINSRDRLQVALPAGNSFNNRCHARFDLQPGGVRELTWEVPPDSEAAAFMEIWMPESAPLEHLVVELEPPSGPGGDFAEVRVGDMQVWPDPTSPAAAVIFLHEVPQATRRTMALLALAPTTSFVAQRTTAAAGRWKVRVRNKCNCVVGPITAQIASNGSDLGASRRGRQSHFADACFDPTRYLSEADDDATPRTSPIERRRFLNGIATGAATYVFSGYRLYDSKFAKYSSAGPSEQLPGKMPTWAAVSEESPGLVGLRAAGTRSGSTVRMSGTSVASAEGARCLANKAPLLVVPPDGPPPFDGNRGGRGLMPLP